MSEYFNFDKLNCKEFTCIDIDEKHHLQQLEANWKTIENPILR